ncbi:MAG: exodeoxyribonuclease VII small subunit [Atopobiaceae bacterium]|jgi:exonuclease VII small subunit|nr:exodeoxyribonuclease VII small subunit [Atopobiaceae bacterium]
MARRVDTSSYTTFGQITDRLDQIVTEVKRKDLSLESSLDLFDEAIALGSKAVDFVDTAPVTPEEAVKEPASREAENAPE